MAYVHSDRARSVLTRLLDIDSAMLDLAVGGRICGCIAHVCVQDDVRQELDIKLSHLNHFTIYNTTKAISVVKLQTLSQPQIN